MHARACASTAHTNEWGAQRTRETSRSNFPRRSYRAGERTRKKQATCWHRRSSLSSFLYKAFLGCSCPLSIHPYLLLTPWTSQLRREALLLHRYSRYVTFLSDVLKIGEFVRCWDKQSSLWNDSSSTEFPGRRCFRWDISDATEFSDNAEFIQEGVCFLLWSEVLLINFGLGLRMLIYGGSFGDFIICVKMLDHDFVVTSVLRL